MELTVDIHNEKIMNDIVLPRLRQMIKQSRFYAFRCIATPSLKYKAEAKIGNTTHVELSLWEDNYAFYNLELNMGAYKGIKLPTSHILIIRVQKIILRKGHDEDELFKLLEKFRELCTDKENETAVIVYNEIFEGIT